MVKKAILEAAEERISQLVEDLGTCEKERAELYERWRDADRDAERWRNARSLADEISDPTLRGVVTTFLDRFGTPSHHCGYPGCIRDDEDHARVTDRETDAHV